LLMKVPLLLFVSWMKNWREKKSPNYQSLMQHYLNLSFAKYCQISKFYAISTKCEHKP
jgi:hypothetical protein